MAATHPIESPLTGVAAELLNKIEFERVYIPPPSTQSLPLQERLVPFVAACVADARHLSSVLRLVGNHMHLLEGPNDKPVRILECR